MKLQCQVSVPYMLIFQGHFQDFALHNVQEFLRGNDIKNRQLELNNTKHLIAIFEHSFNVKDVLFDQSE